MEHSNYRIMGQVEWLVKDMASKINKLTSDFRMLDERGVEVEGKVSRLLKGYKKLGYEVDLANEMKATTKDDFKKVVSEYSARFDKISPENVALIEPHHAKLTSAANNRLFTLVAQYNVNIAEMKTLYSYVTTLENWKDSDINVMEQKVENFVGKYKYGRCLQLSISEILDTLDVLFVNGCKLFAM